MTEEIIIDKEDKTRKHRNNEIDCLHFGCRKGESGNVLFWCDFYDDHCDNYTGCYYRKYLRLEQENKELKEKIQILKKDSYTRLRELSVLDAELDEVGVMNNNYRSALEEIKQTLNNLGVCNNGVDGNCRPIRNTKREDCYNAIYKIKGIIREVLQ